MTIQQHKKIKLTQGFFTLVDAEDYERVNHYKWFAVVKLGGIYAERTARVSEGKPTHRFLHRFILGEKKGMRIDHINRDGLDNRKENLRVCTVSQNNINQKIRKNNTSGYRGISWQKNTKRWVAQLRVDRKYIYNGLFKTSKEAARAYDDLAKKYHGEFAQLNFTI